jgi:predicted PurR-regulated permease PerM
LRSDILFAIAMLLALYVGWLLREVLLLVYVSGLFAVVLTPVVRPIMRLRLFGWHPGKGAAVAILLIGSIAIITAFSVLALPPAIYDLRSFVTDLPTRAPVLVERLQHLPFANKLDLTQITGEAQRAASTAATYVISSLPNWASRIFEVIMSIVLTVYFMLEGDHAYQWFLSFFAPARRKRLDETLQRAEVRMGKWLLGQGLLMLILGITSTIVFGLLHIRYYYLLGVLMGITNIIPIAGALVSVALAAMVAAVDSWSKVMGVLIFQLLYSQIESAYLTPRIMRTSVDLAGLSVLIALLFGASLAGIVGALVAVPTAVLVAVLMDEYLVQHDAE